METLLLSNAAGAINPSFQVGDIMIIKDQVSFFTPKPLWEKYNEVRPPFSRYE